MINVNQMLRRGLRLAKIDDDAQLRRCWTSKVDDFKAHFGRHPLHLCRVWRDLQLSNNPHARVNVADVTDAYNGFMAGNNFLRVYNTERVRAPLIQSHVKDVRDKTWFWVYKIAALKEEKIVWPNQWDTTLIISVDGKHRDVNEPRDPNWRRNPKWWSHKSNHAGVNNEIGIHLWESRVVWANEWDVATAHDATIFSAELEHMIPAGRLVIADKAYGSEELSHVIAAPNPLDSDAVKDFKKRARARHENFNGLINVYGCLKHQYRHGTYKHQKCFDAVVTLCQYGIEDDGPDGERLDPLY